MLDLDIIILFICNMCSNNEKMMIKMTEMIEMTKMTEKTEMTEMTEMTDFQYGQVWFLSFQRPPQS